MKRNTPIATVMTSEVETVHTGQPMSAVAEILRENGFRHLPVVDGRRPVGMISATDVFKLVYDHDGTDSRMASAILDHEHTIEGTMTTALASLTDSATVYDAADMLSSGEFGSIVVVDGNGDLAGLVTTIDLIRFLRDQF
ncbi:MAG: CBS domain-containing protein [Miltoncostaeaceae bacterium]